MSKEYGLAWSPGSDLGDMVSPHAREVRGQSPRVARVTDGQPKALTKVLVQSVVE